MIDLHGKMALITGGGRGIGFAIAAELAAQGAEVVITGRNETRLNEAVTILTTQHKAKARHLCFDVTDGDATREAMKTLASTSDHLDILVNNAGINLRAPLESLSVDTWDEVLRTNLRAVFTMSQSALPLLRVRGGKVVNISSLMAEIARPTVAAYSAAKGGVRQLTKAMAVEWAPYNIQVNSLVPGYIGTDMNTALMADKDFNAYLMRRIPAARWGKPAEVAKAAVFLASAAADYITGQDLIVDGGLMVSL